MERQVVFGVIVGGADVVFVGVHEASRIVVVHHPRLNCRLLYPLIDLCFVLSWDVCWWMLVCAAYYVGVGKWRWLLLRCCSLVSP